MKIYFIPVLLLLLLSGCFQDNSFENKKCNVDCTTLEGQIFTTNQVPLKNIQIQLQYKESRFLSDGITRIKEVETDENGFYKIDFYITDSQLGTDSNGYFTIYVNTSDLDDRKYLHLNYIPYGDVIYSINKRDTIINKTFYIPEKTYTTVHLKNYNPIAENDLFKVRSLYPYGLKNGPLGSLNTGYQTGSSESDFVANSQNSTFDNVPVAKNEKNIIYVMKIKNGISTPVKYEVFIPENESTEFTFEY
jgi:hypothetical protein